MSNNLTTLLPAYDMSSIFLQAAPIIIQVGIQCFFSKMSTKNITTTTTTTTNHDTL